MEHNAAFKINSAHYFAAFIVLFPVGYNHVPLLLRSVPK